MEENLNQISNTIATSDVANNNGLFLLAIPFIYVIICCIVSNSSEKKVYFYSYSDVLLSILPVIAGVVLFFYASHEKGQGLEISGELIVVTMGISSLISVIFAWFFAWRANQGHFFMTLFMFIGKVMFNLACIFIIFVSFVLTILRVAIASEMKRKKYQRKSSLLKEKIEFGSAAAVGGTGILCGLMGLVCKHHNFSIPPKVIKQSEIVEVGNDEEI